MRRTHYATIVVLAIILGITAEILIISIHGANPFADMSRLIVGSIMWVILIMIALLLFFFMYTRMSNSRPGLASPTIGAMLRMEYQTARNSGRRRRRQVPELWRQAR